MTTASMRRSRLRLGAIAAAAVTAALVMSGCSGQSSSSGDSKAPIKVAQITTISGGYPFGDTVKGTQSYINYLNANGGVNGHKVEFESGDDKGDAAEAAQLARKFVQQDGVVGMVGNTSLVDCQANKGIYEANHIAVIGGGPQSQCFNQSNWAPVNAGPYVGHWVEWQYAFKQFGKNIVACGIDQNDPTSIPYFKQLQAAFEKENNVTFKMVTFTNDSSQDPTPAVTNAKSQGCQIIFMSTVATNFAAFIKTAKTVGLDATFMCGGSCYDASLPDTLGDVGKPGALGPDSKGVFVGAELAPVDDDNKNIETMVTQFKKDGVTANFWSEIGWLSGKVFFEGLEQDKNADVTTAAGVLKALKAMKPIDTGFAATPLTFGSGSTHAPNLGSRMLTINADGKFVSAPGQTEGWTQIKALPKPQS